MIPGLGRLIIYMTRKRLGFGSKSSSDGSPDTAGFGYPLPATTLYIGTQPSGIFGFIQRTCSQGKHSLSGIFLSGLELKTIQFEKHDTDREACPFVAINKWMVANQASRVQGSQRDEVGGTVGVMLARPGESRF